MVLKPNIKKDLGYLIIENLYSDSELKFIWNEIKHIDYVFDKVFDDASTQKEVYEQCAKDIALGCFDGYNATILAYG